MRNYVLGNLLLQHCPVEQRQQQSKVVAHNVCMSMTDKVFIVHQEKGPSPTRSTNSKYALKSNLHDAIHVLYMGKSCYHTTKAMLLCALVWCWPKNGSNAKQHFSK
eukprot:308148-Amphidinium_carterae.1